MNGTATEPLVWAEHLPMVLTEVEVTALERLSPAFLRITLEGPGLAEVGLVEDGPWLDQRFKLVVPDGNGAITSVADADASWLQTWAQRPASERGHMRTYTIRALRGRGADTRLDVDVVLHPEPSEGGEHPLGPGARWAADAVVGSRAVALLPRRGEPFGGIEFLPGDASRLLLVADETAVPAVCAVLETLPADAVGAAFLEVPTSDDVLAVSAPAGVQVLWVARDGAERGTLTQAAVYEYLGVRHTPVVAPDEVDEVDPDLWETPTWSSSGEEVAVDVVAGASGAGESGAGEADVPHPGLYAWIAGESAVVTALRRHLVKVLGIDRKQVAFMGYWRRGVGMKS